MHKGQYQDLQEERETEMVGYNQNIPMGQPVSPYAQPNCPPQQHNYNQPIFHQPPPYFQPQEHMPPPPPPIIIQQMAPMVTGYPFSYQALKHTTTQPGWLVHAANKTW